MLRDIFIPAPGPRGSGSGLRAADSALPRSLLDLRSLASRLASPGAVMPCAILRPIVCAQSPPRVRVIVPAMLCHRSAHGLAEGVAQCGTDERPTPRRDEAAA